MRPRDRGTLAVVIAARSTHGAARDTHTYMYTRNDAHQHHYVRRGARLLYLRRTTVTGITMSNGVVVGVVVPTRSIKVCGFSFRGTKCLSILL